MTTGCIPNISCNVQDTIQQISFSIKINLKYNTLQSHFNIIPSQITMQSLPLKLYFNMEPIHNHIRQQRTILQY
jgi:hypothetical protein